MRRLLRLVLTLSSPTLHLVLTVTSPGAFRLVDFTPVQAPPSAANPAFHIAAAWQGILHTDRDLRFVFNIIAANDGMLRATFYNLDGAPGGIPRASSISGDMDTR